MLFTFVIVFNHFSGYAGAVKDARELTILRELRQAGIMSVGQLAESLQASEATIRRDLTRLEQAGIVRRMHGGAMLVEADAPFAEVERVNAEAKERIALAAADLIETGQSIILDIGTTTLQLARLLHGRSITVITSSFAVLDELRDDPAIHLIVLPGDYNRSYRCVSGYLTQDVLRNLRADQAFLGVSGVSADGRLRDTTMVQVPIKRAMAEVSAQTTVLADSSKFPGAGAGLLRPSGSVTRLITDTSPGEATVAALLEHGVSVAVA